MNTRAPSPQDHADEPRLIFPIDALRQAEQATGRSRQGAADATHPPRPSTRTATRPSSRSRPADSALDAETRRLLRSVEKTLDRLQQGVNELAEEVRNYRFPSPGSAGNPQGEPGGDRPRAA